ncbi:MAG: hypothetical protein R2711_08195 [Acidimicrobiales bacterium]
MRKFWSKLAVVLGKRVGLVAAVGLLITGILGFGLASSSSPPARTAT